MKQIFILTILFLCSTTLRAQDESYTYRPFVEEGKVWVVDHPLRKHYIKGDTIVAGRNCKKWIQEGYTHENKDTLIDFCLTVFEENKKVWFFFPNDTTPRLFFDFGAQVGDTLRDLYYPDAMHWTINGMTIDKVDQYKYRPQVIKDISYEEISGRMQKKIDCELGYWYNFVMEGVGGYRNYLYITYGGSLPWQYLISCTVGNETLFDFYYGTGIRNDYLNKSSNGKSSNGILFDLSGRRLSAPPARGVYIEDGKKIIK